MVNDGATDQSDPGDALHPQHAHEILTPLTVAQGRLQLARRYLTHADGARVAEALESLALAERHVLDTAHAVRCRAKGHPDGGR